MSFKSFLKLVEIQTKVASFIPFLLGTVYAVYRFDSFNIKNFIIMFISLLSFDMATTAINNYFDYKKAKKLDSFGYNEHNAIVRDNLTESSVKTTICILITLAVVCGILLFLSTNIIILILGVISFLVGILYSFGPIPISRTPFGEVFSGLFMGFIITFIAVYIHIVDLNIVKLAYSNWILSINVNMKEILYIFLISVPAINSIANIMLANNICDREDDIVDKRYTLAVYVGTERALIIFKALYYLVYIDIVVLVILKVFPVVSLVTLLTLIPIYKNIKIFYEKQTKKDTFILAVKNFVIINLVQVFLIGMWKLIS